MNTLPQIENEMQRLIDEAQNQGILLRLIGGLAVKIHCPHASHRSLEREYPDIDFVTDKASSRQLTDFFSAMGYTPSRTMNTLSGDRRRLYFDEGRDRQIDVFIDNFEMCHKLPLAGRLHVEPVTIPLAELFLTKAQIVELNRKDVLDLLALLLDHEVGPGDEETLNTDVIAHLCAKDWGLYTTISMTVQKLNDILDQQTIGLDESRRQIARSRLAAIRASMDAAPKTMAWKMRARVGTRVRWYEEVEEVRR